MVQLACIKMWTNFITKYCDKQTGIDVIHDWINLTFIQNKVCM